MNQTIVKNNAKSSQKAAKIVQKVTKSAKKLDEIAKKGIEMQNHFIQLQEEMKIKDYYNPLVAKLIDLISAQQIQMKLAITLISDDICS